MGSVRVTPKLYRQAASDELAEIEVFGKIVRYPVGNSAGHGIELAIELAGAHATQKGEIEQTDKPIVVRSRPARRRQQVRNRCFP